ncbi:MAG: hypothetical protein Q7S54_01485 [bacterium]|nr:hypothetical protein [bacterium]
MILAIDKQERERVLAWREQGLIAAGYPLSLAVDLAHSEADLHEAVRLVKELGCKPELAAEILL